MARFGLFGKSEPYAGNAVIERKRADSKPGGVDEQLAAVGVEYVPLEVEGDVVADDVEHVTEHIGAALEDMDCHRALHVVEGQRREQSGKTEKVVAVEMRYEYMSQAAERYLHAPHHCLGALAAVDHEERAAAAQYLA
ncbi:unknown [Prevotella sp. CAG:1031]|nr:unknown [Prevotella sp. CAG:1031]